jgi:hypothetical protein
MRHVRLRGEPDRRAEVPVLVIPVVGGAEEWFEETVGQDMMAGVPSQSTTVRSAA